MAVSKRVIFRQRCVCLLKQLIDYLTVRCGSCLAQLEMANEVTIGAPDTGKERYPCCIVWTPIPLITWLCPIIGHIGIAD